jgi:lipoate-protein ligase A
MSGTEWRLIRQEGTPLPAFMNMAIDESIMEHVSRGESPPTLRFYRWRPSAVSIGYFQGMDMEVDVLACGDLGVDVIRRITGGGAVYHDEFGEVTYSVCAPEKGPLPFGIKESYMAICDGLIAGLGRLGIQASFRPLNDIVVGPRKISGNAQTRRMGTILQHGTILMDVDVDRMFSILRVPNEKLKGKMIEAVKAGVTSIRQELGSVPDPGAVATALQEGIRERLGMDLVPGPLTTSELKRAEEIRSERYSRREWNFRR